MKLPVKLLAVIVTALFVFASHSPAQARDYIRVVGSSTVYPFVSAAAEQFGQIGKYKTPVVESTGTGGGIKLFCEGIGDATPDFANASRPIKDSEREQCKKNGVTDIKEIMLGYDGIVIVSSVQSREISLSKKQLYLALAREIPKDGKLVTNPYQAWNQIDPSLPALKIEVYGPPPTSGTRDAFVELVMDKGCEEFHEMEKMVPDKKERQKKCQLIREDGRYIDSGEDDNIIVQKLNANHDAFGILGYSFYEENKDKLQAHKIEGELPGYETIESGKYKVSRSLFVYAKMQHKDIVPGMEAFIGELTHPSANGPEGYMTDRGLLPAVKD